MGLSLELLAYAENIWHRFPEEFIALGSPNLGDMFTAGAWRRRIRDTKCARVIEIILPHRNKCATGFASLITSSEAMGQPENCMEHKPLDYDTSDCEQCEQQDAGSARSPPLARPCEAVTNELDRLNRAVAELSSSISGAAANEVQQQLRSEDRQPRVQSEGQQSQQQLDYVVFPPVSTGDESVFPPSLVPAAVFSLAMRRGFSIALIRTKEIQIERRRLYAEDAATNTLHGDSSIVLALGQPAGSILDSSAFLGGGASPHSSTTGSGGVPVFSSFHCLSQAGGPCISGMGSTRTERSVSPSSEHGLGQGELESPGALMQLLAQKKRYMMRPHSTVA